MGAGVAVLAAGPVEEDDGDAFAVAVGLAALAEDVPMVAAAFVVGATLTFGASFTFGAS